MGFFSGNIFESLITAGIKTAGEFVIDGASGSADAKAALSSETAIQKTKSAAVSTARVPRPSTPDAPPVSTTDDKYAEWFTRLNNYKRILAATDTGGPRTLGTQQRRN